MNEWKPLTDVLKNLPITKYKSLSRLRIPIRYKRGVGMNEDLCGRMGKIYTFGNVLFLRPKRRVMARVNKIEVFIDEKTTGKLFVWCMENTSE